MKKLLLITTWLLCGLLKAQDDPNEHVFQPERLVALKDTMTISGTVMFVFCELDGDYHIRLRMDSDYVKLSKKNFKRQDSCIILEIVCAHQAIFPISCKCQGYKNHIAVPVVGMKVSVTGKLVFDKRHKWTEIHPVYEMQEKKEAPPSELVGLPSEANATQASDKPILTK
ncbi:MAG: hypothetical protein ACLQQ4_10555 [Bacteroidia bacterium]